MRKMSKNASSIPRSANHEPTMSAEPGAAPAGGAADSGCIAPAGGVDGAGAGSTFTEGFP
jgi:hypothetical protein